MSYKRDLKILEIMTNGPIMTNLLFKLLEDKFPSMDALYQRLKKLRLAGLIESRKYFNHRTGRPFSLHTLTKTGAEHLLSSISTGLQPHMIRTQFPANHTAKHDLLVSAALRSIRREHSWLQYRLDYSHENSIRQTLSPKHKYTPLPDLAVVIIHEDNTLAFDVEVDLGSIPVSVVIAKVIKRGNLTFFLCSNDNRIGILHKAFRDQAPNLSTKVLWGRLDKFCMEDGAFSGTDWSTANGEKVYIKFLMDLRKKKLHIS